MLSFLGPGVVALNVKTYAQGVFAATIAAQVVFVGSALRSTPLARQERPARSADVVTVTETGTL
jgi:hypothetical protein